MKYLICGLGSIGQRHLANLLQLGENDIICYRKKNRPLKNINKKVKIYTDINKALLEKPDAALITNPSALHIPLAIELAKNNCHLFIEKPLSSDLKGIKKLKNTVNNKKRIVFTAFVLRYHPAALQIKKWLKENIIGPTISVRMTCGQYLPSWHPGEDYRKSYAANKNLGGGPINTLCHEIDLLSWFFGKPVSVTAFALKKSSLKLTTEHGAEIILNYSSGLVAEIHLDYLQLPPKRLWEIIGDKGRLEFDYYSNQMSLYKRKDDSQSFIEESIDFSKEYNQNSKYLEELKDFIASIKQSTASSIDLNEGINNLKILIAAHQSIKKRRTVYLKEIKI